MSIMTTIPTTSNRLADADPEVARILQDELIRQSDLLALIPSENYTSRAVLEATGSVLSNKYAEGYGDERYYNGCAPAAAVEALAIERALTLFGAEHANVQVHSGCQANMAVYFALLEPGDTVLAMNLDHGGHLSHGQKINFSGRTYDFVPYGVDPATERIDYDEIARLAAERRPKLIVAGASAYPRSLDFARFAEIARDAGAYLLADISHICGLVAGGVHPDPVPHADVVTSTTHKTLRGPRGAVILCKREHARAIDRSVFPGVQSGPFMNAIAAKAVAFGEAATPRFADYARQVVANAAAMAENLASGGLRLVSGGTDNHLMLVDLRGTGLTGKEAADALEESGIVVNKNTIPFDERSPRVTSGIRLGSPAITSRGMKEAEARRVAALVARVVKNAGDPVSRAAVRGEVGELCRSFPIYEDLDYLE